jgi:hypothetical protein
MILKNSNPNTFGKKITSINARLVAAKNVSDEDVDKIKRLHKLRNCYVQLMEIKYTKEDLKYLANIVTQIDFQLQKLWKFKEDSLYHRFWELPKCECPSMDNIDVYGTGHRYINPNCKIHG